MTGYPLDPPGTTFWNVGSNTPNPPYPFTHSNLNSIFTPSFHNWSIQASIPIAFSIAYYIIAHGANRFQSGSDLTKGSSILAQSLRFTIIVHNALLCLYSWLTFAMMSPVVLDMFWQGYRAAGWGGLQVALCSMPTNYTILGRWTYLFYLSKYYEVVDSLILFLKGKHIGNLQSYHHAGALICMWIAYRYQSQPVWVFCVFNSGVHTFMYAYYFCSALRLPFPKALKKNLTTLQIIQIASGTLVTNLYFIQRLEPQRVASLLRSSRTQSLLPASVFGGGEHSSISPFAMFRGAVSTILPILASETSTTSSTHNPEMQLLTYADLRAKHRAGQSSCLERKGAELALHVNTMYMLPLLALFANFFIRAYLQKSNNAASVRENGKRTK